MNNFNQGWVCPICKKVLSPMTQYCIFCCKETSDEPKLEVLGNYMPSNHDASRVVSENGIAPTVKENHGTVTAVATVEQVSLFDEPKLEQVDLTQNVRVRKYNVDTERIIEHNPNAKHQQDLIQDEGGISRCTPAGTQWFQQDRIYTDDLSVAVNTDVRTPYYKISTNPTTVLYKDKEVELPCIVASRGRNPENPSDRTAGIDLEQQLEINTNSTSNTLTTVQKDNYVLEEVEQAKLIIKNNTNYNNKRRKCERSCIK